MLLLLIIGEELLVHLQVILINFLIIFLVIIIDELLVLRSLDFILWLITRLVHLLILFLLLLLLSSLLLLENLLLLEEMSLVLFIILIIVHVNIEFIWNVYLVDVEHWLFAPIIWVTSAASLLRLALAVRALLVMTSIILLSLRAFLWLLRSSLLQKLSFVIFLLLLLLLI